MNDGHCRGCVKLLTTRKIVFCTIIVLSFFRLFVCFVFSRAGGDSLAPAEGGDAVIS